AGEDGGMLARHLVEIVAGWEVLLRPEGVIPAAADDPFALGSGSDASRDAGLHLLERGRAHQIDVQLFEAAVVQVHVSVVESRHDKTAAQVHNLRSRAAKLADFG